MLSTLSHRFSSWFNSAKEASHSNMITCEYICERGNRGWLYSVRYPLQYNGLLRILSLSDKYTGMIRLISGTTLGVRCEQKNTKNNMKNPWLDSADNMRVDLVCVPWQTDALIDNQTVKLTRHLADTVYLTRNEIVNGGNRLSLYLDGELDYIITVPEDIELEFDELKYDYSRIYDERMMMPVKRYDEMVQVEHKTIFGTMLQQTGIYPVSSNSLIRIRMPIHEHTTKIIKVRIDTHDYKDVRIEACGSITDLDSNIPQWTTDTTSGEVISRDIVHSNITVTRNEHIRGGNRLTIGLDEFVDEYLIHIPFDADIEVDIDGYIEYISTRKTFLQINSKNLKGVQYRYGSFGNPITTLKTTQMVKLGL